MLRNRTTPRLVVAPSGYCVLTVVMYPVAELQATLMNLLLRKILSWS
jgi:hypothetical protein